MVNIIFQMEGDSSGQSQTALANETDGLQHSSSNVLTVRQTDDQEMGLAVAILELVGSQPHIQVLYTNKQYYEIC